MIDPDLLLATYMLGRFDAFQVAYQILNREARREFADLVRDAATSYGISSDAPLEEWAYYAGYYRCHAHLVLCIVSTFLLCLDRAVNTQECPDSNEGEIFNGHGRP